MKSEQEYSSYFLHLVYLSCSYAQNNHTMKNEIKKEKDKYEVAKTEEEWKASLSPEAYHVLREKGTERAFTGEYWDSKASGTYHCRACGHELFNSNTKYDSGSGWPSFYQPVDESHVAIKRDTSHGMVREEVVCGNCGSHLGHVFPDGPKPTGLRYCMNSVSLKLEEKEK